MADTILTPLELSLRLKVKVQTLAKWRMLGFGPKWFYVGKLVRYHLSEVEKWELQQDKPPVRIAMLTRRHRINHVQNVAS